MNSVVRDNYFQTLLAQNYLNLTTFSGTVEIANFVNCDLFLLHRFSFHIAKLAE